MNRNRKVGKPFALPIDPIVAGRHELLLDLPKFGSHATCLPGRKGLDP